MKYSLQIIFVLVVFLSSCGPKIPPGETVDLEYIMYLPDASKKSMHDLAIKMDYPFLLSIQGNIFLVPEPCIPERALNGTWQGRSLAGGREGRNRNGGKDERNLGGGRDNRNLAGADDGRNLAGDDNGRNLGGDNDGRNLGGANNGRNLAGANDGRNLAGDNDGRNLGGDDDGRNRGGGNDGRNAAGGRDGRNMKGDYTNCQCFFSKTNGGINILEINKDTNLKFYNGKKFRRVSKDKISVNYF